MQLSIIIVNFNVKHFVELAILSAQKACKGIDAEIIVVDNQSSDGSIEYLASRFPDIQLIANPKNTGFAVANNQAMRLATGKYILLLNPDTIVAEDTFHKCLTFMEQHTDAGSLGVKMIDGTGTFLPESKRAFPGPAVAFYKAFGLSSIFPKSKLFGQYHLGFLDKDETHEVDVLAGAFMLIRKEALDKTGLLDEAFFMYGEDIDLSFRIKKAGYKNYYFHETPIIHFKGESTKKGSLNYVQMFYNAMKIFARKHFSGNNRSLFIFFINLAIYFRATLAILARFFKRSAPVLLDLIIMVASLYIVKEYWEYYVRYIDGGTYPDTYLYINTPIYTIIWLIAVYLSGGYDRDSNPVRIIRALFWGTVVIAAVYGFLPESLRFSRGMIVAGAALAGTLVVGSRYLMHFASHRNFRYGQNPLQRIMIIGQGSEASRVHQLLDSAGLGDNVIGYAGDPSESSRTTRLGSDKELDQLIALYQPGEIIFCMNSMSNGDIIAMMDKWAGQMAFKMVASQSSSIVGSNSKNTSGDRYDIRYNLAQPYHLRIKRLFDIILALLWIPLLPLQLILVGNKAGFIRNIFRVLSGKYSWVGYCHNNPSKGNLPMIKPGILCVASGLHQQPNTQTIEVLDKIYAREYNTGSDLKIIRQAYRKLGNNNSLQP